MSNEPNRPTPRAPAKPIRTQNLTYGIASDLGVAIVTGRYSKENPFPIEGDLCRQYGVSRSILREAVKMLTAKGLLGARPRQGTWIQPEENWNLLDPDVLRWILERKFSLSLLMEFAQIRLGIEPAAAALAARAATPEGVHAIQDSIERMRAAARGEDDPLDSDIAFHVSVLEASGNSFFMQLRPLIETALKFSIRMTNDYKGVRLASVADHKKVADAIEARDPAAAEASMRAMMEETLELMRDAQSQSEGRRARRA
jgi:DNA-binding FadR family transcriptional regulator